MKRVLALIAACVVAGTVAGSAPAKGSYTSDIFLITHSWDLSQTVTEKGLGKSPVTFATHANGLEEFFCPDGSLAGKTSWSPTAEVTVTPQKSKATGTLIFQRPRSESSLAPCSDGSTPQIGYILYSNVVVTDSYGNTLTIPDQTQGTPA
jgi:hypothetical protein